MVTRWLILLLLVVVPVLASAQTENAYINIQLDGTQSFFGDTLVLDVESTGLLDPIDFTPLEKQVTRIRETTGTRIAVIGGKVVEIRIRRIEIVAKQPGVLVIGPLTAGDVTSNSVHNKVLDATRPNWQPEPDDIQISTSLLPDTSYVSQKMLFTIELLHRYPIYGESITLPDMAGFSRRVIFENRRTFKDANKEWYQTQSQYLIFPKRSGSVPIDPVEWTGTIARSRAERAEFSRVHQPDAVVVKAANVKPGDWWLPADSLQLTEEWSKPPTELRAGDELERTLLVKATSVLAGQIPTPAVPESRAVKQSLIDTQRSESIVEGNIVSSAQFTYRVKAQSPIPVFLDTVRIPWWNTRLDEPREAIIPARRINVGLPDRTDLLSSIALQETGISRFTHWSQSADKTRTALYGAAALSLLLLAGTFVPSLFHTWRQKAKHRNHIARIRHIARSGDAERLYQILQTNQSRHLFAGKEKLIMQKLGNRLFSDQSAVVSEALTDMIKPLLESQRFTRQATKTNNVLTKL